MRKLMFSLLCVGLFALSLDAAGPVTTSYHEFHKRVASGETLLLCVNEEAPKDSSYKPFTLTAKEIKKYGFTDGVWLCTQKKDHKGQAEFVPYVRPVEIFYTIPVCRDGSCNK